MNYKPFAWLSLAAPVALLAGKATAQSNDSTNLNHLSLSARIGFNVNARFKNLGALTLLPNGRTTPDGNPYNYNDGYVLTDISGSAGGQTWNWGYDSASQVAGNNTILMNRTTPGANAASPNGIGSSDPQPGWELNYDRELGTIGKWHYGVEGALNYMRVSFSDNSSFSGNAQQTTDAYPYTPGTTPPVAPYQGTFNGPGFLLGATPVSSTTSTVSSATVVGQRSFKSDIWGMRVGPYFERPLTDRLSLSLSGGFAAGLLVNSASWNETIFVAGNPVAISSGTGHNTGFVWGGYVSADLAYQFSDRWSAEIGAQFQDLGKYQHDVGSRAVEVDLSKSLFVTVSVGYHF